MNQEPFPILVISTDEDDQLMFSEAIERIGPPAVCTNAFTCRKALADLLSGQIKPKLIFLDAYMDDMDGLECLRFLKQHPEFSAIPVVMLSGIDNEKIAHEAMQLGALHLYQKPVLFSQLLEMIKGTIPEVIQH